MPKTEKVEKVRELTERIEGSQAVFLTDFRGLTVLDATDLRRSLRQTGTRFAVVKNTLMKRAAGEAGTPELEVFLEGPTAVAFVDGDPIAAAKSLVEAIRRYRTMSIKGGYMEGRVLSAEQAQALATTPPREVLLARLAGLAKSEMSRAAYMFQALQSRFLSVLEAYKEKVPGPAEPEASAAAEPEPAAEEAEAGAGDEEPNSESEPEAEASGEGKE
ncbi:MAG: 50S ribosomal protein L10 [Actinomycetota bacterium]|nr:50S ribosomal protein L10 [Actinomycetota bacterium]